MRKAYNRRINQIPRGRGGIQKKYSYGQAPPLRLHHPELSTFPSSRWRQDDAVIKLPRLRKALCLSFFCSLNSSRFLERWLCACILADEEAKVCSRCFHWFSATILVPLGGTTQWRLYTERCKFAWNVSEFNSTTGHHTELRLGDVVYLLVLYNIWNSLNGLDFIFWRRDSKNR